MTDRILVSFNHHVGVMLEDRVILIQTAICEEIGQVQTELTGKVKEKKEDMPPPKMQRMFVADFPLFLRVISLGDGKVLAKPIDLIVKWNNISAICELK